ncbi:MAG: TRAP transporter small permease [Beijerinckiaceae bacterium]|nr:TRAP transporter small permease [Beijerinckiaceae bacterium]MCZ8301237.1 TRAP transporter small permease [Beijerinckiaceae bacterium]
MSVETEAPAPAGAPASPIDRIAAAVAMAGGLLSVGLALMVVTSIALRTRWIGGAGVPGDFELAQMLTAVSVFCFLPFCQARKGHVIVDAASQKWSPLWKARVDALWEIVAGLVLGLMAWQLGQGALGMVQSGTRSMVLGLPLAPAVWTCTALCFFLAGLALWRGLTGLFSSSIR